MESDLRSHKYFSKALDAIEDHPYRDCLTSIHAAVLVKGGSILSVGVNSPKRNMFVDIHALHEKFTTHAECAAILRVRRKSNLRGAKIYVARLLKKDGSVAMSKPCRSCQTIIKNYGIKTVHYTTDDGDFETLRASRIN